MTDVNDCTMPIACSSYVDAKILLLNYYMYGNSNMNCI